MKLSAAFLFCLKLDPIPTLAQDLQHTFGIFHDNAHNRWIQHLNRVQDIQQIKYFGQNY